MTKQEAQQTIEKILDGLDLDDARDLVSDLDDYIGGRDAESPEDDDDEEDDDA